MQLQLRFSLSQVVVLLLEVREDIVAILVQRLETSHFILQCLDLHFGALRARGVACMSRGWIMIFLQLADERLLLSNLLVSSLDLAALLQVLVLGVLRFLLVLLQLLLQVLHECGLGASTLEAARGCDSGRRGLGHFTRRTAFA